MLLVSVSAYADRGNRLDLEFQLPLNKRMQMSMAMMSGTFFIEGHQLGFETGLGVAVISPGSVWKKIKDDMGDEKWEFEVPPQNVSLTKVGEDTLALKYPTSDRFRPIMRLGVAVGNAKYSVGGGVGVHFFESYPQFYPYLVLNMARVRVSMSAVNYLYTRRITEKNEDGVDKFTGKKEDVKTWHPHIAFGFRVW